MRTRTTKAERLSAPSSFFLIFFLLLLLFLLRTLPQRKVWRFIKIPDKLIILGSTVYGEAVGVLFYTK